MTLGVVQSGFRRRAVIGGYLELEASGAEGCGAPHRMLISLLGDEVRSLWFSG